MLLPANPTTIPSSRRSAPPPLKLSGSAMPGAPVSQSFCQRSRQNPSGAALRTASVVHSLAKNAANASCIACSSSVNCKRMAIFYGQQSFMPVVVFSTMEIMAAQIASRDRKKGESGNSANSAASSVASSTASSTSGGGTRSTASGRDAASNFVDECSICAQGGDGGTGCVSFRREAQVARGGPDGGDGGNGGDVWLVADHNVSSLLAFRDHPHRRAGHGAHGSGKKRHGAAGQDCLVLVPEGTVVRTQQGELLADLVKSGDRWRAARGGEGGRGNARFLSNKRRAPAFAERLEKGEERWLRLELKLLADVALVGFPNAGKSTLISRISAAKPKIAAYPFTTLEPNLGVVRDNAGDWVVADVPGLIEGASQGVGLGTRFLRHIERARVLVVLLDPAGEQGLANQREVLLGELEAYESGLLERPRLIAVSKSDLLPGLEEDVRSEIDGLAVDAVFSAATGEGLEELVVMMAAEVTRARDMADLSEAAEGGDVRAAGSRVVHKIVPDGISLERERDGWRIIGREAERAVALTDLSLPDAMSYALDKLNKLGVDRLLRREGARDGDTVRVGDAEFVYSDDSLIDN